MKKTSRIFFLIQIFFVRSHEEISRSQFPKEFFFGVATSSYQVEGAVLEDGRGFNNWDIFSHIKGNILDGDNADVADDHYHLFEEDVDLMHSLGINAYRFSISWTRILPKGRFGDINPKGIEFYNKLIDRLVLKGLEPFVTISHHDIPQELEDRYQSWLSPLIQDDFAYYADICFRNFGDRVKYWITINEPNLFVTNAYITGSYPPRRCSPPFGNCSSGDSDTEPLVAVHNMLLSHAKATKIYRKHYQAKQGGYITIVPHAGMFIPISDSEADREAAKRAVAFTAPWILDPLIHGEYPPEMRQCLGNRLPKFSPEEVDIVKDSLDFIGINHYATLYAKDCIHSSCDSGSSRAIKGFVYTTGERNGTFIGEPTGFSRFFVVPKGLEMLLEYLKIRYNNKPMFLLENGMCQADGSIELDSELLHDIKRVNYHKSYLASLKRAMRNGADVRSYFVWSLIDNFEWTSGYSLRYGLYYVDYQTLKRIPKSSSKWYRDFLTNAASIDSPAFPMALKREA
ncbi:Beta-glucosidase [Thalictrum thalictroides]|uniref:Beta-glucosidase n=1 Tax=Thalictrum thalictroides TaxID=46969 RepID=A0A7J6VSP8_THATH|nr:Beta-glucosidase [Thalictrum thalictroides]